MIRRVGALVLLSLAALVALAVPAGAHVEIEPEEAVAGSTTVLTFNVEFEGATVELAVQLPEGATVTDVPDKEGWTSEVDSAANTVTWSGGPTTDDDTFDLEVQLPTTPGVVLFPAVEQASDGSETAWIEAEESEGETGHPAPRLTLVADASATTTTEASTTSTTQAGETTTTNELPGTTLEADERDDGTTSAAPWIIGAGLAAIVAIAVGGLLLKRKQDREDEQDRANAAAVASPAPGPEGPPTTPEPGDQPTPPEGEA